MDQPKSVSEGNEVILRKADIAALTTYKACKQTQHVAVQAKAQEMDGFNPSTSQPQTAQTERVSTLQARESQVARRPRSERNYRDFFNSQVINIQVRRRDTFYFMLLH